MVTMTPDGFSIIGEAIYGPSWRCVLADALKVGERTVRRWAAGSPIPDGIPADLATICRRKIEQLSKIADQLEQEKNR
jgi:hypothetical protein